MLAIRQYKLAFFYVTVMAFTLLSGCSRDNPLTIPAPHVEDDAAYCLEGSPLLPVILESVELSNIIEPLPSDYPQNYIDRATQVTAPYLINRVVVKPVQISNYAISRTTDTEDGQTPEEVLVILSGTLDPVLSEYLTEDEKLFLKGSPYEVITSSVTVLYTESGLPALNSIDEETNQLSVELLQGTNLLTVNVDATIKVPRTPYDCEDPLEFDATGLNNSERFRNVTISQTFPIYIERQSLSEFKANELESYIPLSEGDKYGKVLAVNENFLAIGLPNEDTDAQGIYNLSNAANVPNNEQAQDSGAVLLYQKNSSLGWDFHSYIKASNSESGDLFGTALALSDQFLVVSAPGEDSVSSGIFKTSNSEFDNIKVNNSAPSSGAVYLYKYDKDLNTWIESYYIKPEENIISDGNYDKAFGSTVAINNNLLLVSAPNENSLNGDFGGSLHPNSGAVYNYRFSENDNNWEFGSTLKALYPGADDQFGSAISLSDTHIAVSAPFEDSNVSQVFNNVANVDTTKLQVFDNNESKDSGAVYLFSYSNENPVIFLDSIIKASNNDAFDYFGTSLILNDSTLIVGATGEDSSGRGLNRDMNKNDLANSGAAYHYSLKSNTNIWTEKSYIKANDSQENASFGKYLALFENNLFISSPLFDTENYSDAGKVYLYNLSNADLSQELQFQETGKGDNIMFGSSLAIYEQYFMAGASGYIKQDTGMNELFVGKLFSYK